MSEKVVTIYSSDEFYSLLLDFMRRLSLWIDDIKSYRKEREKCQKIASKARRSGNTTSIKAIQPALDEQERAKLWFDSGLSSQLCMRFFYATFGNLSPYFT